MKLLPRKRKRSVESRTSQRNGSPTYSLYAGSGACDVCNTPVGSGKAFEVPTSVFWASKKYRVWVDTNPTTKTTLLTYGITVDEFIAAQRARDKSKYSAVCPNCVHLFQ